MKRTIVTLCGSTKFEKEFHEVNKQLTARGHIVISCGIFGHTMPPKEKELFFSTTVKAKLDCLHNDKILMSDCILVIDVKGYIGSSTKKEIDFAKKHKKGVYYYSKDVIDSIG